MFLFFKVCVADFNVESGEATVNELNTEHGDGNAIFCKCDVTSETEFEGIIMTSIYLFSYLKLIQPK